MKRNWWSTHSEARITDHIIVTRAEDTIKGNNKATFNYINSDNEAFTQCHNMRNTHTQCNAIFETPISQANSNGFFFANNISFIIVVCWAEKDFWCCLFFHFARTIHAEINTANNVVRSKLIANQLHFSYTISQGVPLFVWNEDVCMRNALSASERYLISVHCLRDD